MYGPKKTNINHHKFYHPGSGANREKFNNAEQRESDRAAAQKELREQAEKDRQALAYEQLKAGTSAAGGAKKFHRLELVPDRPGAGGIAKGTPAAATGMTGKDDNKADAKTGIVSQEEAASARKALDDARKAAADPLTAIRLREAAALRELGGGDAPTGAAAPAGTAKPPPMKTSGLLARVKRPRPE